MDSLSKIQSVPSYKPLRQTAVKARFFPAKTDSSVKVATLIKVLALLGAATGFFGIILFTCIAVASGISLPITIFGISAFSALEMISLHRLRKMSPM